MCPFSCNSALTKRIFMKSYILVFFEHISRTFVSLKSDNNKGYFTWRPAYIHVNISLNSSYNEKLFRQNLQRNLEHALCSVTFFSENRATYGTMYTYTHTHTHTHTHTYIYMYVYILVVRVYGYRYRGLGFDSRRYQIFWVVVGLERDPLSLVRSIEELLE